MSDSEAQSTQSNEFEAVKARLEEIADEVGNEELSLDEALDLYEEAVKLGLQASNLLEVGISVQDDLEAAEAGDAGGPGESGKPDVPGEADKVAPNASDAPERGAASADGAASNALGRR